MALPPGALSAPARAVRARRARAVATASVVVDGGRRVVLYGGQDDADAVRGDMWCLATAAPLASAAAGAPGEPGAWTRRVEDEGDGGMGGGAPRA